MPGLTYARHKETEKAKEMKLLQRQNEELKIHAERAKKLAEDLKVGLINCSKQRSVKISFWQKTARSEQPLKRAIIWYQFN